MGLLLGIAMIGFINCSSNCLFCHEQQRSPQVVEKQGKRPTFFGAPEQMEMWFQYGEYPEMQL